MQVRIIPLPLTKRFPLTISRGTSTSSENLIIEVIYDGITGQGEMSPFNIGCGMQDAESARAAFDRWIPALESVAPWEMQRIEAILDELGG